MNDKYPKFLPQWTDTITTILSNDIDPKYNNCVTIGDAVMAIARKDYGMDWYSSKCCLTGEAFFHIGAPADCDTCEDFTFEKSHNAFESKNQLYQYKNELATHLQKYHKDIWNMWKEKI